MPRYRHLPSDWNSASVLRRPSRNAAHTRHVMCYRNSEPLSPATCRDKHAATLGWLGANTTSSVCLCYRRLRRYESFVNVIIREITTDDPRLEADFYPLLAALRPGLSMDTFDTLMRDGGEQGLRVLVADQGRERCIGAALYRIVATSRGRVTFLDDLVTAPARRSKGVGAALLAEVERRGRAAGCDRIELDSGVNNQGAHRFYHRHGLHILALHFAKELDRP